MAVAKYKKGKDGYFSTRVWDGTYTQSGKKHYKHLRSRKSSKDLERKVKELEYQVKERNVVKKDDITFLAYARRWKTLYKSSASNRTKEMYDRIIEMYRASRSAAFHPKAVCGHFGNPALASR